MGGYAVKQSADFAALFKEVRERSSAKPTLEKPKSTLFFSVFCCLAVHSFCSFYNLQQNCCARKKEGRSHPFSPIQLHLSLFAPEESIFFSNSITLFLLPKDVSSSSPPIQSLLGWSQGRMHFVLQLKSLFWVLKDDTCCSPIQ